MKKWTLRKFVMTIGLLVLLLAIAIGITNVALEDQNQSRAVVMKTYEVSTILSDFSLAADEAEIALKESDTNSNRVRLYKSIRRRMKQYFSELTQGLSESPDELLALGKVQQDLESVDQIVEKSSEVKESEIDPPFDDLKRHLHVISSAERLKLSENLQENEQATHLYALYIGLFRFLFLGSIIGLSLFYAFSRDQAEKTLTLQYAITKLLNEQRPLAEVLHEITGLIAKYGKWNVSTTWLINEAGDQLDSFDIWFDETLANSNFVKDSRTMTFKHGEALPGRVWATGKPTSVADLKASEFKRAKQADEVGLRSGFAFPILTQDRCIGVIDVFSYWRRKLDAETIEVLELVGREIGMLVDRQRTRAKLNESELRFRAAFDQTYELIGLLTTDGILLDANESALAFSDIKLGEVLNKPFWDTPWWSHSQEQQNKLKAAIKTAAGGEFVRFEASHPRPDGAIGYVDFSLKPLLDAKGAVRYIIPEGRDITDAKRGEQKFHAVFNSTYEFIALLRLDGALLECNATALNFVGAKLDQLIGLPFWETPWWSHSAPLQVKIKEAVLEAASGKFARFESSQKAMDGSIHEFDVSIKPVMDEREKVSFILAESRDISEKKKADRRLSEFYSTVTHELRNPLTSIRGSLGLIEGGIVGDIPPKAMEMVEIARSQSDRLIRLVNDFLDLKKIEVGNVSLKLQVVDAAVLIESAVEGMKGMAHIAQVDLLTRVSVNDAVNCDHDRIIQVITNLVSNAIKFSPAHSEVVVSVEKVANDNLRFSIVDHGAGIPSEQAHKLFQRFQQVEHPDGKQRGGTGLGLAITKAIIEEHHGRIGVDTEVGEGSTFWFELPAAVGE